MNELAEVLKLRFKLLRLVREFFWSKNFIEVETPAIVPSPGMEPNLNPFEVSVFDENGRKFKAGLITSPEYAMKKLLAIGFKNIFQICKCFRNNEPFGGLHNPEFTMIEWYRVNKDYKALMRDVENLFLFLLNKSHNQIFNFQFSIFNKKQKSETQNPNPGNQQTTTLDYQGRAIDVSLPWERMSVCEAFRKYAKINLEKNLDKESLEKQAKKKGYIISKSDSFSDIFFKIFLTEIEPKLGQNKPTFIYDYPAQMAALSRLKKSDSRFAERFELYIAGIEIANAFSELTDAAEQLQRLKKEAKERRAAGKRVFPIDKEFITAVEKMPECAGIALGLDRLFMILLDIKDINDIIPFPASNIFK